MNTGLLAGKFTADFLEESTTGEHSGEEHSGVQRYLNSIISLGYGVATRWNMFLDIPYEYRVQSVHEVSQHHQNETLSAPGDIKLRFNYLWKNQVFGPGWRIYSGGGIILPTGSSYERNVFAPEADTVYHSHMVTGQGNYQMSIQGEVYYRSDFPVATGLVLNGRIPVWNPADAYTPGLGWSILWVNYVHTIRIASSVPRINILFSGQRPESWGNNVWPNSGGYTLEVQLGWITEFSQFWIGAFELGFPVYKNYRGSQLSGAYLNMTIRYIF